MALLKKEKKLKLIVTNLQKNYFLHVGIGFLPNKSSK